MMFAFVFCLPKRKSFPLKSVHESQSYRVLGERWWNNWSNQQVFLHSQAVVVGNIPGARKCPLERGTKDKLCCGISAAAKKENVCVRSGAFEIKQSSVVRQLDRVDSCLPSSSLPLLPRTRESSWSSPLKCTIVNRCGTMKKNPVSN